MKYKDINDYELVYLVKENDDYAMDILLKKYDPIFNSLSKEFIRKYPYIGLTIDDLVQESKVAFMKALKTYNENSKDKNSLPYTYILFCLRRHLINVCKSFSNTKHYILNNSYNVESLDNIKDETIEDVDQTLISKELFFRCKNMLNFEQSAIFELKINGFSNKEIGTLLDISGTTLIGRVSLIRKILKNNLNLNI